jgi:hypothetical protein
LTRLSSLAVGSTASSSSRLTRMRSRGRAKILQGLGRCAAPAIVGPGDGKMNCLDAFVTLLNSKCMPGAALLPLHLKSRNVSGGKRNIQSPGRRLHQQPRLNTPGSQTSTDRSQILALPARSVVQRLLNLEALPEVVQEEGTDPSAVFMPIS